MAEGSQGLTSHRNQESGKGLAPSSSRSRGQTDTAVQVITQTPRAAMIISQVQSPWSWQLLVPVIAHGLAVILLALDGCLVTCG